MHTGTVEALTRTHLNNLNRHSEVSAKLIAERGTQKMTYDDLKLIETPPGTDTHKVIAHHEVVDAISEGLMLRSMGIVASEFAVSNDGQKVFGVLEINHTFLGVRFALGLRNSHNKSLRLGMVVGYRVMVCSNLAFNGEYKPLNAKHTKNFELTDALSVGLDRICRQFKPLETNIRNWQERGVTDEDAKLALYDAFVENEVKVPAKIAKVAHKAYFQPDENFRGRTLWCLSNACTQAMKELAPASFYPTTARLGAFLNNRFNL